MRCERWGGLARPPVMRFGDFEIQVEPAKTVLSGAFDQAALLESKSLGSSGDSLT
jgi:hypothetical protein